MIAKGQAARSACAGRRTWPTKDIFHEYALDFAKKVNDMTGGDLKIEVLPAGAVVPAFGLLDAVSKGTLDGGHGVLVYHYGKQNALALWGSGPAFGMDANMLLSWHKYGGGKELLNKLYASIGANVVSFPYGPMPTQPLGWFKKPITKAEDFKGLKFRTVGISIDVFTAMGAAVNALPGGEIVPAMDRGLLDAAEFNNATSDRLLGFPDVSKVCMLQSFHQNAEQFEITVQQDQVRRAAGEDEGDHRQRRGGGVGRHVLEGDRPLLEGLRRAADQGQGQVLQDAGRDPAEAARALRHRSSAKKSADNPLFKEIVDSQKAFAERAVQLGPGHQRQPAHGLQPLLRQAEASRAEEGLTQRACDEDTIRRARMVFFLRSRERSQRRRDRASRRIDHAEAAAVRRQGQHLGRPGVLLAHRGAHAAHHLGSVLALRARPPARLGVRRHDHDVRDAVHDGRRLHAVEERPRARRRALRLLPAAPAGRRSTSRSTSCSSFPGVVALVWAGYIYAGESWAINEHSNITADGPPIYPFKTVIPIAGAFLLVQGIVEIIRCVICLKQGEWPSREEDVEEVDVDKLKEMVHVKDEDIAEARRVRRRAGSGARK